MNDDVIPEQAHFRTAPDAAFCNHTTGDFSDPGDVEHFSDRGVTEQPFAECRCEQSGQRFAHVVDQIINDRVVPDLDAVASRQLARLWIGADVEADDYGIRSFGEDHVTFVDAADGRVQYPH